MESMTSSPDISIYGVDVSPPPTTPSGSSSLNNAAPPPSIHRHPPSIVLEKNMCTYYMNTRWLCHKTKGCKAEGRACRVKPSFHRPPHHRVYCNYVDPFTGICYGAPCPGGKRKPKHIIDRENVFYKSIECPWHHHKKILSLETLWDEEWTEQIIKANLTKGYREFAERRKHDETTNRERVLQRLFDEAIKGKDVPFYRNVLNWQNEVIANCRTELVKTMKWV
ncbi:hypothetical protein QBC40DRAFT_319145 [Triangularia verruculosa]|uniref:Uncharacterized protein n=1 Tax=Triangularia verruculosa TaxID=2587418 RepID=A0AAN6XLQ8_9PEZI|nr:hypothetical protein QBC40DRAFT_319145 [Triangularia verruculosa]